MTSIHSYLKEPYISVILYTYSRMSYIDKVLISKYADQYPTPLLLRARNLCPNQQLSPNLVRGTRMEL